MQDNFPKFSRIIDFVSAPHPFYDGFRVQPIQKAIVSLVVLLAALTIPLAIAAACKLYSHTLNFLLFTPAVLVTGYLATLKLKKQSFSKVMLAATAGLFFVPTVLLGIEQLQDSLPVLATIIEALLLAIVVISAGVAVFINQHRHKILTAMLEYVMESDDNPRYQNFGKNSDEDSSAELPGFSEFEEAQIPEKDSSNIHVL